MPDDVDSEAVLVTKKGEIRRIDEERGKTTLVSRLSSRAPRLSRVLSVSSRPPTRGRADIAMASWLSSAVGAMVRFRSSLVIQPTSYWRIAYSGPDSARSRNLALRGIGVRLPPGSRSRCPSSYQARGLSLCAVGMYRSARQHPSLHTACEPNGPSRTLRGHEKVVEAIDKATRLREAPPPSPHWTSSVSIPLLHTMGLVQEHQDIGSARRSRRHDGSPTKRILEACHLPRRFNHF